MTKNILITGFEPFNNNTVNLSWECVKKIKDSINNYNLVKLLLPVKFGEAADITIEKAKKIDADYIICIGEADNKNCITPEMVAINWRNAKICDNCGYKPEGEPIISNGPAAYFSTADITKTSKINNKIDISYSAGTFVCNDLFYNLLHYFNNTNVKICFIHVPNLKSQIKHDNLDFSLDEMVKLLTDIIATIVNDSSNN